MDIIRKSKEKYAIEKMGKKHRIIKILNEYESEKEAIRDLTRLLTGEILEKDILDGNINKE